MKKNIFLKKSLNLLDWLNYIETFKNNNYCSNFKNLIKVAKKLHVLSLSSYIFLVAGTNGKGSTCYSLEKLFLLAGHTVGMYISPHFINYEERIRINGNIVCELEHIRSFKLIETVRNNIYLNYFEYITLSALIIFKKKVLDILILEVGLGGKYDPTNIVEPNVSIITNVGLDHIDILGNTLESIAYQKVGVFRKKKLEF